MLLRTRCVLEVMKEARVDWAAGKGWGITVGSAEGGGKEVGTEGRSLEEQGVVAGERVFLRLTAARSEGGDDGF